MTDLIRKLNLGDIHFGVPGDIEVLNRPFGFYEFLGVTTTATPKEIKRAQRMLVLKFHPDKEKGDARKFNEIMRVSGILLDDGGELGHEHSGRSQYDRVSTLDDYFDGFIQAREGRTKKLSEIMLIRMQGEKMRAEADLELGKMFPEYHEVKEQYDRAKSPKAKEEIGRRLLEMAAKRAGINTEDLPKVEERLEEAERRRGEHVRDFFKGFSPGEYRKKVLDIFYLGGPEITFGLDPTRGILGITGYNDGKHILELVLGGECYVFGFPKVHFKAPEANVTISDPGISGIFHVIEGSVNVDFPYSSYGEVIRARGKSVLNCGGFVQEGDLYVPERFATEGWWRKKPAIDIAVQDGCVFLSQRSQDIGSSLEDMIIPFLKENYINNNLKNSY